MKTLLLSVLLVSVVATAACSGNPVMDEVSAAEPAEPAMQTITVPGDASTPKPAPPARQPLMHATQKLSPYRHPHASRHTHLKRKRH